MSTWARSGPGAVPGWGGIIGAGLEAGTAPGAAEEARQSHETLPLAAEESQSVAKELRQAAETLREAGRDQKRLVEEIRRTGQEQSPVESLPEPPPA